MFLREQGNASALNESLVAKGTMEIEDYEREIRHERKWKNINFVVAIIAFLSLIGLNLYYSNVFGGQQASYSTLYSKYTYQNGQIAQLQQEMENMLQTYDQKSYDYITPSANTSLDIWGLHQTIAPKGWIEWSLIDTFVNRLDISSNASATYVIVDPSNFVQLYDNITLHQSTPFTPLVQYTGTHFVKTERLSQGCSGYMLVIINYSSHPILLMPNVTATFAPTTFLTGDCSF